MTEKAAVVRGSSSGAGNRSPRVNQGGPNHWILAGHWKSPSRSSLVILWSLVIGHWLFSSASSAPITVGVIGDYGSDNIPTRQVAKLVKSWQPHFVLTLGDNNYPVGSAATIDRHIGQFYHEFIGGYQGRYGAGAFTNRFFPCLGNHDWATPKAQPYLDYFTLPGDERYYAFKRGAVEFFCLDSDKNEPDGTSPDSPQGQWLQQQLTNSTAVWKVVYFHHAPLSSGAVHGTHTGETLRMNWPFHQWGADAVLAGHDHVYERIHTNGIVYFVNGLGGDSKDKFHTTPVAGSVVRYSADYGAMRIDASTNYMLFRFFSRHGQQIDSLRLVPKAQAEAASPDGTSPRQGASTTR
jgi:tartrate-resistant acid phosphatase type 5